MVINITIIIIIILIINIYHYDYYHNYYHIYVHCSHESGHMELRAAFYHLRSEKSDVAKEDIHQLGRLRRVLQHDGDARQLLEDPFVP
jgi:hypothetical protein